MFGHKPFNDKEFLITVINFIPHSSYMITMQMKIKFLKLNLYLNTNMHSHEYRSKYALPQQTRMKMKLNNLMVNIDSMLKLTKAMGCNLYLYGRFECKDWEGKVENLVGEYGLVLGISDGKD